MSKRTIFFALAVAMAAGAGCGPNTNPDNTLLPRPWTEVNGNKENSGFNAVHSQFALPALQKWVAPLGSLSTSAPVIGPDGVIWTTNMNGELVGTNPDGSLHRRRKLDDFIVTSAAVNADTNEVFVVGQHAINPRAFSSTVYRLDSGAGLLGVSSAPLVAAAGPKLWGHYLFIPSSGQLAVLDQNTLAVVANESTIPCFNLVCGESVVTDVFVTIVRGLIECSVTVGIPDYCSSGFTGHGDALPSNFPSAAIIDAAAVVGDPNKPIAVVVSSVCACGFRFDPTSEVKLQLLWSKALVPVDCDFQTVRSTAPVAVYGGAGVVFGNEHGRVLALDTLTGAVLWDRTLSETVVASPVSSGIRQVYVVESNHLAMIDDDGTVMTEVPLVGAGRFAMQSLDFVYVGTSQVIHTFPTLPDQGYVNYPVQPPHFGAGHAALATDGTLYVTSSNGGESGANGVLVAYRTP